MLIDQFNLFLKEASKLPFSFWSYKYYLARKSFGLQLERITEDIKREAKSKKDLNSFTDTLKKEEVDELEIAQGFNDLSKIFLLSQVDNKKIEEFKKLSQSFLQRAQNLNNFATKRQSIKKRLAEKEIEETDKNLFKNEGINYCLEYYLAVYKKIEDLESLEEKEEFIQAPEVNLGFGNLPGIKKDFEQDESLVKFILLILDDELREELIIDYYRCKIIIDEETDIEKISRALKIFIHHLLISFDKQGIDQLTSNFFKPYGDKPNVKDLITIFEK